MLKAWLARRRGTQPATVGPANEPTLATPPTPATAASDISPVSSRAAPPPEPLLPATCVADILQVEEITDAEFYAGDLFRRRFGGDPPDYPRHYVAFYRAGRGVYQSAGYVHYSPFEDSFLCGGLVIDDRVYRRMQPEHRNLIKADGGIAEYMLRQSFARLSQAPAIWGYVGNKQAEAVDLRAGFVHTTHQYIMVVWNRAMSDDEKQARLDRVIQIGPF
jgi:hypothetical protein